MKPISNTAFFCCGVRMLDADSKRPICGDRYAKSFMDERGMEIFRRFGGERGASLSTAARHRFIDDYLREKLAADRTQRVILIGSGFDSRAFRLEGGDWIELDEPAVINFKDQVLPAGGCPNALQRVAVDFADDSLADKLAPFAGARPTVFIIEGVTMYLQAAALEAMLTVIRSACSAHEIVADLMTKPFIERRLRSFQPILAKMGAAMIPQEDPAQPFTRLGYRERDSRSVIALLMKYRGLGVVAALIRLFSPTTAHGYTVRIFVPVDRALDEGGAPSRAPRVVL